MKLEAKPRPLVGDLNNDVRSAKIVAKVSELDSDLNTEECSTKLEVKPREVFRALARLFT